MNGNPTILLAVAAGLLSFLSPCVLPLVPAYLGQLTAVAVAGSAGGAPSRWTALRHAVAYVAGFGAVFTILGITATFKLVARESAGGISVVEFTTPPGPAPTEFWPGSGCPWAADPGPEPVRCR